MTLRGAISAAVLPTAAQTDGHCANALPTIAGEVDGEEEEKEDEKETCLIKWRFSLRLRECY